MDKELLLKLREAKDFFDEEHSEKVDRIAKREIKKQNEWWEKNTAQRYKQKGKMFNMVYVMTHVTYWTVLFVIISQVVDLEIPMTLFELYTFKWIVFLELTTEKLGLILTGFLAELLLLPKIILQGLFTENEKQTR